VKVKKVVFLLIWLLVGASTALGAQYGFGYQPSVGGAAAAVADKLGFFAAEGLDLKIRIFADGTLISEALAANAIQFGVVGDLPTITLVSSGVPVKIIGTVGGGGSRQRLMVADPKITDISDLRGERVGVTRGTSGFTAFQYLCTQHQIPLTDFQIINISPPNMPEALSSGQVKAVLVWEPTPSLIEAAGVGRELLNLGQYELTFPLTIIARTSVIQKDRETVCKILRSLARAAEFIRTNPGQAAEVIAQVTGLDPEIALKSLGYHNIRVGWTEDVAHTLKYCAELLYREKQLRTIPDWNRVVDSSFCLELGY